MIALLPFLAKPFAHGIEWLKKLSVGAVTVLFLGMMSILHVWVVNGTFFYLSATITNPIYHQSIPLLLSGCLYPTILTAYQGNQTVWIVLFVAVTGALLAALFDWNRIVKSGLMSVGAMVLVVLMVISLNTIGDSSVQQHKRIRSELRDVMSLRACKPNRAATLWLNTIP